MTFDELHFLPPSQFLWCIFMDLVFFLKKQENFNIWFIRFVLFSDCTWDFSIHPFAYAKWGQERGRPILAVIGEGGGGANTETAIQSSHSQLLFFFLKNGQLA